MKLIILGKSYNFNNKVEQIEVIFNFIDDKLNESQHYFSHLCINSVEIYAEFETYIKDHLDGIQVIEVVAKTIREFTNELLLSLEQYLSNALPEIELLATKIYQSSINTNSVSFGEFIEGLLWISDSIVNIDSRPEKLNNWDRVIITVTTMQEELITFEEAIKNQDDILIADIMQYELLPILEILQQDILLVIDSEVDRNDTN